MKGFKVLRKAGWDTHGLPVEIEVEKSLGIKDKTEIEIKDNGRGLNNQIEKSKPYISRAKQIVTDRIYLLNLKLKSDATFSIENDGQGKGVMVKIVLPVIY